MERPLVLVVDSDPAVRAQICDALEERSVSTLGAGRAAEAAELLRSRPVNILWVDARVPGAQSFDLLSQSQQLRPEPLVVGIAGGVEEAARLVGAGAFDVLDKPIEAPRLRLLIERVLRQLRFAEEQLQLRRELQSREGYRGLVGRSGAMERLRGELVRLAGTEGPVCFTGEPGTGKELAARTLHELSRRGQGPFLVVDCSAAGDLDELLEQARGGTLYLDEFFALSPEAQGRLPDLLAGAGGGERTPPEAVRGVRLISSTIRDPRQQRERGQLPERLLRSLFATALRMPPLRERTQDIAVLARHFITAICEINRLPPIQLAPESLRLLEQHGWPGNVRELRNAIEQAVILAAEGVVQPHDLPESVRDVRPAGPVREPGARGHAARSFREAKQEVVEAFERNYLAELLQLHSGNVTSASQRAGMLRSALQRLLRKHELRSADFRRGKRAAVEEASRLPRRTE